MDSQHEVLETKVLRKREGVIIMDNYYTLALVKFDDGCWEVEDAKGIPVDHLKLMLESAVTNDKILSKKKEDK